MLEDAAVWPLCSPQFVASQPPSASVHELVRRYEFPTEPAPVAVDFCPDSESDVDLISSLPREV